MKKTDKTRMASLTGKSRAGLAVFVFIILAIILIPFLLLVELFFKKYDRPEIWRKYCLFLVDTLFLLGGLKIHVNGFAKFSESNIYIANHQTGLDGFIVLKIIGSNAIAFTGPAKYFPFPFSYWFQKMDYIDVQRSNIEKIKFKKSYQPHEAMKKASKELHYGRSMLIFPEGHISLNNRLQYFHTGAARLALATNKKIIPIGITGIGKLIIKDIYFRSGGVKVKFGKPIDLVKHYRKNQLGIKEATMLLRKSIRKLVPARYYARNYLERKPSTAIVLVTLNNCLYDGNAENDFLNVIRQKKCYKESCLQKIATFFSDKKEGDADEYVIKEFLKNKKAEKTYKICKKIFDRNLKFNINEKVRNSLYNHFKRGHQILLITDTIAPLAKCFADYTHAEYWIGKYPREEDMRYTGEINQAYTEIEQIKFIVKTYELDLSKSYAITNENRKDILELAKNKCIVNPTNKNNSEYTNKKIYDLIEKD